MDQLLSNTLREKRQRIIENDHNPIIALAKKEARGFTPEERVKFDALDKDIETLTADIARAEKAEERALEKAKPVEHADNPQAESEEERKKAAETYKRAFTRYIQVGLADLEPEERSVLKTGWKIDQTEKRAQSTSTTGGGYTIPQGFQASLEASMKAFGSMRQAGSVFPTDMGADLPWPTYDDTSNVGALLAENTQGATQDVTFGQIVFKAYKYSSKIVLVSAELLQDSAFDFDTILGSVFGERIGRITNTHFTTGDNSGKPQGAIPAGGTTTAANAASIVAADLIDLFHSVDPAYRSGPKVAFQLNDATLKAVRKLVDNTGGAGQGNFLWMGGLSAGIPDTILGKPYFINQDIANIGTGNKSAMFGDFSKYKIRDVKGITVLRLVERYADFHQVGFLAFSRADGRTLDAGTDPIKVLLHP